MFHIGQKVVCIEDRPDPPGGNWPGDKCVKDAIYTVSNVFVADDAFLGDAVLCLEFIELFQPGNDDWWPGYLAIYFRPVIQRNISIEIFTHMLTPASPKKLEPA